MLSLCIYIISYLSSKSKKPHNQVATQLPVKLLNFRGELTFPHQLSLLLLYRTCQVISNPCVTVFYAAAQGFSFLFMQLASGSNSFKCSFLLAVKETNQRKTGTSQIFILLRSTAAPRNSALLPKINHLSNNASNKSLRFRLIRIAHNKICSMCPNPLRSSAVVTKH